MNNHTFSRLSCSLLYCLIICLPLTLLAQLPDVIINEFQADNESTIQDPDYNQYSDWLELYNTSIVDVDLSGYFLTDNMDNRSKWKIPTNTIIPAMSYLIIWADNEDSELHTNFKLSKTGEELALSDPDTITIDSIRFGSQGEDFSFGRLPQNQTQWVFYNPASPETANNTDNIINTTPDPLFSLEGGFYAAPQLVSFANNDQLDIYYTHDGTPPDQSSTPYSTPITVSETTPIRAIAYRAGNPPSSIITNTYFIDIPVNLPVISIVTDPDNFFHDEIGIYVTGTNGTGGYCGGVVSNVNQDWERPVNIELYEVDGDQGLNQRAGIKIFGGCSRHRYPQKSLSLFARSDYGDGSFRYKLFEEKPMDNFESFVLRSSADDQVYTLFRDAAGQELLVNAMETDYQAYQPVVVYLNGDYWGIHNIREKLNEHYVEGNFGVDSDEVNILSRDGSMWNASHGSNEDYEAMMDFVTSHNLGSASNYLLVEDMMNIGQYIDYMIGHMYLAERDWPGNNIKFWKANSGPYDSWRWINYDMDQTLTVHWITENMIQKCTTTSGPSWPNPEWSTRLFRNLLDNSEFETRFLNRYAWHMSSTFDTTRVFTIIDSLADRLRPEIPNHIDRWGGIIDPTGGAAESWIQPTFDNIDQWEFNVDAMRTFARERRPHATQNMVDHFGLSGASQVEMNLNTSHAGVLQIEGNHVADGFEGLFFNDIPFQLSTAPFAGYEFSHWETQSQYAETEEIFGTGSVWHYNDQGLNLGSAWFELDYDDSGWAFGPGQIGYGDGDEATQVGYGGNSNNKHITTYFRRDFQIPQDQTFESLSISLLVDDGGIAYLNGNEVGRVNMPSGDVNYLTTASGTIDNENAYHHFSIPPDWLTTGENVWAVEIHQANSNSSDISFDCSMTGSTSSGNNSAIFTSADTMIVLSGNIALTAHFEPLTEPLEELIVITELNYQSSDDYDTGDWIELYNNAGAYVDLTGWTMVDGTGNIFEFPQGFLLEADQYLVLCRDTEQFSELSPDVEGIMGDIGFGLSSSGEVLRLIDATGQVVDELAYEVTSPWPTTALGTGYTIEFIDLDSDNSNGESWVSNHLHGSPGSPYIAPVTSDRSVLETPHTFTLFNNYPNPFNPSTSIRYSTGSRRPFALIVYNVAGQQVQTLRSGSQAPGDYQIQWDGRDNMGLLAPSGIYIVRLHTHETSMSRKMLLLR